MVLGFRRMNPPEFHGSKVYALMDLINEAHRIITMIWVPSEEKAKLVAYQLNGVVKIWYEQWVDEMDQREGQVMWEKFKGFLDQFFLLELREAKV